MKDAPATAATCGGTMATLEKLLHERSGVKLVEMTLHNGPFITDQRYVVTSPLSPVTMSFPDLREAERALLKEAMRVEGGEESGFRRKEA